jgi:hypothetical protein
LLVAPYALTSEPSCVQRITVGSNKATEEQPAIKRMQIMCYAVALSFTDISQTSDLILYECTSDISPSITCCLLFYLFIYLSVVYLTPGAGLAQAV